VNTTIDKRSVVCYTREKISRKGGMPSNSVYVG